MNGGTEPPAMCGERGGALLTGLWIGDSRPVRANDCKIGDSRLWTPHRLPLGMNEGAGRLLGRRGRLHAHQKPFAGLSSLSEGPMTWASAKLPEAPRPQRPCPAPSE